MPRIPERRLLITAIAAILSTGVGIAHSTMSVQAACSGGAGGHYYATVDSGTSDQVGTGATTTTWSSWSVANNGVNFSDVAVWLINPSNGSDAIEAGFYSGGGSNVAWTNGMLPYWTLNNGVNEYDGAGNYLASNKSIWMAEHTGNGAGVPALVQVDNWVNSPGNYYVGNAQAQRHNYSQFETYNNNGIWMGGGSGQTMTMYWNANVNYPNGPWYQWGFIANDCNDPGYWHTVTNGHVWAAGGY